MDKKLHEKEKIIDIMLGVCVCVCVFGELPYVCVYGFRVI